MAGFAYYVIQHNDTARDSIFVMLESTQGVYSKMLGVVRIFFLLILKKLKDSIYIFDVNFQFSYMLRAWGQGLITPSTVCPRSSNPFYIVSTYMKWVTTSWTYRMYAKASGNIFVISLCSMMRLSIKLAVKAVR